MLIDAQGHIGRLGQVQYAPEDLRAYVQACRVDRVLVSNVSAAAEAAGGENLDETDANVAALKLAAENAAFAPLYWLRPGRPDHNLHAFAGALHTEPFVGVVMAPILNDFPLCDEAIGEEMKVLGQMHRPVLVYCGRRTSVRAADVYAFAARHGEVPFVLYRPPDERNWLEYIDGVRRARDREDARLYLSTAHATVEEIVRAAEAVGADRLLFGSDAPHAGAAHGERVASLLDELRTALPEDNFRDITGQNAFSLFFSSQ